jgi:hypothetical protein
MVGPELSHIDISKLSELLTLLNIKNVLVFEAAGIKVTLAPSGPPVVGEASPNEWEEER